MPIRIQRKRTKDFRLPPNTVCVDRTSRYGNPWRIGSLLGAVPAVLVSRAGLSHLPLKTELTAQMAVDIYRAYMVKMMAELDGFRAHPKYLKGKNVACFCPLFDEEGNPVPCHCDVLLELANGLLPAA